MAVYSTIARDALLKEYNNLTTRLDILKNEMGAPDEVIAPLIKRLNQLAYDLGFTQEIH